MKKIIINSINSAWEDAFNFEPTKDEFNAIYKLVTKVLVLVPTLALALGSLLIVIFVHNVLTWSIFLGLLILGLILFIFIIKHVSELYKCLKLDARSEFYEDTESKEE